MKTFTYIPTTMNEVSDPATLQPVPKTSTFVEMAEIVNLLIDNDGKGRLRDGFTKVYTGAVTSMFTDGATIFFKEGSTLKKLLPDFTAALVRGGLTPGSHLESVPVNDVIVFTDGGTISLIQSGVDVPLDPPTDFAKLPTPPGQLTELVGRSLLVARGTGVYITDPDSLEQCDGRLVKDFPEYVTMLKAVRDGVFVSTTKEVGFIQGLDPFEMEYSPLADASPAIIGTAISTDADRFGLQGLAGPVVVWTSPRGVFLGGAGGFTKPLTEENLKRVHAVRGTAVMREQDKVFHYLTVLQG